MRNAGRDGSSNRLCLEAIENGLTREPVTRAVPTETTRSDVGGGQKRTRRRTFTSPSSSMASIGHAGSTTGPATTVRTRRRSSGCSFLQLRNKPRTAAYLGEEPRKKNSCSSPTVCLPRTTSNSRQRQVSASTASRLSLPPATTARALKRSADWRTLRLVTKWCGASIPRLCTKAIGPSSCITGSSET